MNLGRLICVSERVNFCNFRNFQSKSGSAASRTIIRIASLVVRRRRTTPTRVLYAHLSALPRSIPLRTAPPSLGYFLVPRLPSAVASPPPEHCSCGGQAPYACNSANNPCEPFPPSEPHARHTLLLHTHALLLTAPRACLKSFQVHAGNRQMSAKASAQHLGQNPGQTSITYLVESSQGSGTRSLEEKSKSVTRSRGSAVTPNAHSSMTTAQPHTDAA